MRATPEGLAVFRRIDAIEADSLSAAIMHHLNGIAIDDGDDAALEFSYACRGKNEPQRTPTVREGML